MELVSENWSAAEYVPDVSSSVEQQTVHVDCEDHSVINAAVFFNKQNDQIKVFLVEMFNHSVC